MSLRCPKHVIPAFLCAFFGVAAEAAARPPALLPPGWTSNPASRERDSIEYISPDQRAMLVLRDLPVQPSAVPREMYEISHRSGDTITYQRRGRSWIVISGYRNGEIFYTRANLACEGRRWHVIELSYPRADKIRMDALVTGVSHRLRQFDNVCPSKERIQ